MDLNEDKKQIAFFECKRKDLNYENARKILEDLKEKATYAEWFNKQRKESYGPIAKNIENKADLRNNGYLIYDLADFQC